MVQNQVLLAGIEKKLSDMAELDEVLLKQQVCVLRAIVASTDDMRALPAQKNSHFRQSLYTVDLEIVNKRCEDAFLMFLLLIQELQNNLQQHLATLD